MINVSEQFHKLAFGQIISVAMRLSISFGKNLRQGGFFTLDHSQLNGSDLLKFAASNVDTQGWDFYDFYDYSDRLVSCSWERSLDFPYQIQSAMADFTLDNHDGYFTPLNSKSPVGENNLPARPIKLSAGFVGRMSREQVPQFVGITEGLPAINTDGATVSYHAIDFLYNLCNQPLRAAIDMRDARTDEVIAAILESYGLSPTQYKLAKGQFTIPFVFFDIGDSIGDALKKLVQSENGYMWLDEEGTVRFENSSAFAGSTEPVAELSDYDIVSLESGEYSDIINHVKINAELREVQEYQEVYAKSESTDTVSGSLWVVPANDTLTISCSLGDPCYDVVAPTLGRASSVSWFTAFDEHLEPINDGITASGVLSSSAYTITFTNTHAYPVEINEMKLWGEPAKVYDALEYDAYDDESVDKYGDQILEISTNQFFQSYQQANLFARTLIRQRGNYSRIVKAQIKGDFSFQLLDMIKITTGSGVYDGLYHILGMSYQVERGRLTTYLTLNGTSIEEEVFTLNVSRINGEDLIQ